MSSKKEKEELRESIDTLRSSVSSILENIDSDVDRMLPPADLLPGLSDVVSHDYYKDIELIKLESREILECIANLYLEKRLMKNKNISNIIKNDALALSDLKFSIECAKRGLISCMGEIDKGCVAPDMFEAVTMFQKEMRDSTKMMFELQKKMKDFYKELKDELEEINPGESRSTDQPTQSTEEHMNIIGDPKALNEMFDRLKHDHTLLNKKTEN